MMYRSLPAISRALGMGTRQVQRIFPTQYGLTLRDFRRLIRFEASLAEILRKNTRNGTLAQLAQSAGYFDQAHFDHDFRAFCGLPPSRFCSLLGGNAPELWPFRIDPQQLNQASESRFGTRPVL
jgi:AraC-like DNA-binding protein